MTLAATGTCDGCEREGPVQQLERVLLPSGRTAVCCPECRHRTEQLAERSSGRCQGCGEEVTVADLSVVGLPDGRAVQLCPRCLAAVKDQRDELRGPRASSGQPSAPSAGGPGRSSPDGAGNGTAPHERGGGAGRHSQRDAGEASPDDTGSDSRGDAGGASRGDAATGPASAPATASDSRASGTAPPTADTDSASASDAVGGPGTPAATAGESSPEVDDECDQCGQLFAAELYRVVTIDERTEHLCADCKDECLARGIITDVELQRGQALEALGLGGDAAADEVRRAYHRRVKEVHPDRPEGSRSEFMLVKQAYERLREE